VTVNFVMAVRLSVRPYEAARLPPDVFSWNLRLGTLWKSSQEFRLLDKNMN